MKRTLLFVCIAITYSVQGQLWFDIGAKGGTGTGFPLNSTLNDDGRFNVTAGFNYFFGGKVGVNYGHYVGITCDVDYGSYSYGFTQAEVPGLGNTESFKYRLGYKALSVMPMFRFTKEASYLEIGPQFSFVRNPFVEDEAYPAATPAPDLAISDKLTGITFGFGGHMLGNEIISLMMGLRFNYIFSDLRSEAYSDTSFPFTNYTDINGDSKTTPINVQVVMELNYSLGYIARNTSGCGKRAAFLTF